MRVGCQRPNMAVEEEIDMDEKRVRPLIRKMLQSGRLPYDSASKVSASPAAREVRRVWNRHR